MSVRVLTVEVISTTGESKGAGKHNVRAKGRRFESNDRTVRKFLSLQIKI